MWTPSIVGFGPKLAVKHGRLEETISADSAPPPSEGIFGAALTSRCTAAADLDAQVDYSLLTWPASSGTRIGLRLIPSGGGLDPGGQVERTSFAPSEYDGPQKEVYLTDFGSQIEGSTTTDDLSGKLRIVRTGDTMTGYYWHDGQWTLIHSGPGPTGAVAFGLDVWGFPTSFDHQTAKIAFGNFMVTQGQLDCTQIFAKRIHGSYGFSPRRAKVNVGTRVIWENDTRTVQTITSDTRNWRFDKKLRRGTRLSFVFTSPGTYKYHSKVHPSMKGRVVVAGEPPGQK
jgi:plastocyanin